MEAGLFYETIEIGAFTETKRMELRFSKKISLPTLTCHEIKGEGNTCIELVLYDSFTGKRIEVGPVAFADVELVVLAQGTDDCTGEGFNDKIVKVQGKKLSLLTVDRCELQGGRCVLEGVKFRHHATQVKPSVFRLGARIVGTFDSFVVKEAKSESFPLKCYRNKYFKKNEVPTPTDKISVLKNIQLRGKIEQRLQAGGIYTVEKFLIHHLINPRELKDIARSTGKKWEATINHARKCQSSKMYWYFDPQENSGLVFDILGDLQWMYSRGELAAIYMLSEEKKVDAEKMLSSALEHWEDVVSFDDPDSLQQHVEHVKTSFHQSNSSVPEQYPGMNPDMGAVNDQMIYGSNGIKAPDPSLDQGIFSILDMNSVAGHESFDFRLTDDIHSPLNQLLSRYWVGGVWSHPEI